MVGLAVVGQSSEGSKVLLARRTDILVFFLVFLCLMVPHLLLGLELL
jgi:hypothetical protein